jgi:hypothetical protein
MTLIDYTMGSQTFLHPNQNSGSLECHTLQWKTRIVIIWDRLKVIEALPDYKL